MLWFCQIVSTLKTSKQHIRGVLDLVPEETDCDRELRRGSLRERAPETPVRGGRSRVKQREESGSEMQSQQIARLIPQGMTPLDHPVCAKGQGFLPDTELSLDVDSIAGENGVGNLPSTPGE